MLRFFSTSRISLIMLGALSLLALPLSSCSPDESPETIIRDFVAACEEAAERRDGRTLRGLISEQYLDSRNRTKRDVGAIVSGSLLRNQSIHILSRIDAVSVPAPGRLQATVLVAMAGRPIPDASFLPSLQADTYWFDIVLDDEEGEWKLTASTWRQALVSDFLPE